MYPRRPFVPGGTPSGSRRSTPRQSPHQSPRPSPRPGMLDLPPPVVQAEWERQISLGTQSPKSLVDRVALAASPRGSVVNLNAESSGTPQSSSRPAFARVASESVTRTPSPPQVGAGLLSQTEETPVRRSSGDDAQLPPGAFDPNRPRTSASSDGSQRPKLAPIITDFSAGSTTKWMRRRSWMGASTKATQPAQPEPLVAPELDFLIPLTKTVSKEPNPRSNGQRLKALRRSSQEGPSKKMTPSAPPAPAPIPLPGTLAAQGTEGSGPDVSVDDKALPAQNTGPRRRRFSVTNLFGSSGDLKGMIGTKSQDPAPSGRDSPPELPSADLTPATQRSTLPTQKKISPQDPSQGDQSEPSLPEMGSRRRRFSVTNLFNKSSTDLTNLTNATAQDSAHFATPTISQTPLKSLALDTPAGDQTVISLPETDAGRRRFSVLNMFNGSSGNIKAMNDPKPQDLIADDKPSASDGSPKAVDISTTVVPVSDMAPRTRRFSITDMFSKKELSQLPSTYNSVEATPRVSADYVVVDDDTASSESFHRTSEQRRRDSVSQGLGMWRAAKESTTQLDTILKPVSADSPNPRPLSVGGILNGWKRKPSQDDIAKKPSTMNGANRDENSEYLPVIETGSTLLQWL